MSIGSGLAAQFGIATESVVNTPVAVTRFRPFNSESKLARPVYAQSVGLAAGQLVPEASGRILTALDGGGDIEVDFGTKGMGLFLQHMLGSFAATAVQQGSTAAYQQIHNLGSTDGKTFTAQKGAPSIDGTVNPLTLGGCKITAWELDVAPNGIAKLKLTIDAMSVAPTGAGALGLQVASYVAESKFAFHQAACTQFSAYSTVSGLWTPTAPTSLGIVRNISLKGGQPKDTARWPAGSLTKAEALINDYQPITGQLDIDFASMALYNAHVANTQIGIQVLFTGALIEAPYSFQLGFTMPACFLEQGSTPQVGGPGVVTVSYPFTALRDASNNALQAMIMSTDTTV